MRAVGSLLQWVQSPGWNQAGWLSNIEGPWWKEQISRHSNNPDSLPRSVFSDWRNFSNCVWQCAHLAKHEGNSGQRSTYQYSREARAVQAYAPALEFWKLLPDTQVETRRYCAFSIYRIGTQEATPRFRTPVGFFIFNLLRRARPNEMNKNVSDSVEDLAKHAYRAQGMHLDHDDSNFQLAVMICGLIT